MTAELRFAGGHTGRVHCSMWSTDLPRFTAKVVGDRGELRLNPLITFPAVLGPISQRKAGGELPAAHSTYANQLDAFPRAVLRGEPGEDNARRGGRKHDRHRCDLSCCRPLAARAGLNNDRLGQLSFRPLRRIG